MADAHRSWPARWLPSASRTGRRLGAGFTAAHVWRVVDHVDLASKIPLLFSFVPNVVCLPRDLARLTDIEGGPYQRALQAISWSIYRHVEVLGPMRAIAEEAWAYIATPAHHVPVEPAGVAWFVPNPRTAHALVGRVDKVIQALVDIEAGNPLPRRVVCSRYAAGLPSVDAEARRDLLGHLRRFVPTM